MAHDKLVSLLQTIKDLLLSKVNRNEILERYDNFPNIAVKQVIKTIDELLDLLDSYTNLDKSGYDFEYFFEIRLNEIFNEFKKTDNEKTFLNLYEQIQAMHAFLRGQINDINSYGQINDIKHQIADLYETVSNIAPINYTREKKEVKELIKYLDKKKKETDEIVGDIAENKNAIKYTNFAKENKKAARYLFWVSIAIMGFVAFHCFNILWDIMVIDSKILIWKFPILLLILMPAFFMMRESKKLKDKEFQYYDMACRIITSAPYIDGLNISPEEKGKLKADLVKDFFARPIECMEDGGLTPMSEVAKAIKNCADLKK